MVQSKYVAALAAMFQLVSFLGAQTSFAAAVLFLVSSLIALIE
ncbi:hypothetical protein SAMN05216367_0126 [Tardiphaga sp. OK245]|nr:hypothetical protein SAMN05216367_0126 [Tardiphaga sp. OK245]